MGAENFPKGETTPRNQTLAGESNTCNPEGKKYVCTRNTQRPWEDHPETELPEVVVEEVNLHSCRGSATSVLGEIDPQSHKPVKPKKRQRFTKGYGKSLPAVPAQKIEKPLEVRNRMAAEGQFSCDEWLWSD